MNLDPKMQEYADDALVDISSRLYAHSFRHEVKKQAYGLLKFIAVCAAITGAMYVGCEAIIRYNTPTIEEKVNDELLQRNR